MKQCHYHYECKGEGTHECPRCNRWYCDVCSLMFLPIDNRYWTETAMICAQCHHEIYWSLPQEAQRRM
jgi:hypothetical protein